MSSVSSKSNLSSEAPVETSVRVSDISPVGPVTVNAVVGGGGSTAATDIFTLSAGDNGGSIGYFFDLGPIGSVSDDDIEGETLTALYTDNGNNAFRLQLNGTVAQEFFTKLEADGTWSDGNQLRTFQQADAIYSNPGAQTRWEWAFGQEFIVGNTYTITITF